MLVPPVLVPPVLVPPVLVPPVLVPPVLVPPVLVLVPVPDIVVVPLLEAGSVMSDPPRPSGAHRKALLA